LYLPVLVYVRELLPERYFVICLVLFCDPETETECTPVDLMMQPSSQLSIVICRRKINVCWVGCVLTGPWITTGFKERGRKNKDTTSSAFSCEIGCNNLAGKMNGKAKVHFLLRIKMRGM